MRWFVTLFSLAMLSVSAPASRARTDVAAQLAPPPVSDAPAFVMEQFCGSRSVQQRISRGRIYPQSAVERGLSGHAVLDCALDAGGRQRECQIIEETPPRLEFGKASLIVACRSRMIPPANTGPSVIFYKRGDVQRVRYPVDWRLEK
jgi:TonB family protein